MINSYNTPAHPSDDYLDALRDRHEIIYAYYECNECYERYVLNEEPRPADGYICELLDGCYCMCNTGAELPGDFYDWERECPIYLAQKKEYLG